MALSPVEIAEQLQQERRHLVRANTDIDEGRKRLLDQEHRLSRLTSDGRDIHQAERLVDLMERILVQWERHRCLIEQRVGYLEGQAERRPPIG